MSTSVLGQGSGVYYNFPPSTGGNENLNETLVIGNFTGGQDIVITNGDVIESASGTGALELTNSDAYLYNDGFAWMFNAGKGGYVVAPAGHTFSGDSDGIVIMNNELTAANSFNGGVVGILIGGSGNIINAGVQRSITLGGRGITARSSDVAYTNTLGLMPPSSRWDMQLKADNITDFRTLQLPDKSGTVATTLDYIEAFGTTFNNTASTTWQTVTVPGAPANCVIDVMVTNTSAASRQAGVREVGSTQARIGGTNSDSFVIRTKTNALSQIQVYSQVFTDIDFNLIGCAQ